VGKTADTDVVETAHIRVVIIDDHTIVREGLASILELEGDIEVVGQAAGAKDAVRAVQQHRPDLVLLDLKLGEDSPAAGLGLCSEIVRLFPGVGVIVLTTFHEQALVLDAIRRGAKAYVLKDIDAIELAKIIRAVRRGESGFDTRSAAQVVRSLAENTAAEPTLTGREIEIITLLASGLTNKQIGKAALISESTVKFHLRSIMAKLGVRHRAEVVYVAVKMGLLR
jgi:two-component system, NarL family, response regulator DevR